MGRPLNKRFFGEGAGNQLKVRAKVGANAEGDGFIVRQRSTKRFEVNVAGNIGVCKLVNKSNGELTSNEMIVNVMLDNGTLAQVTKLFNRTAIVEGQYRAKWNFEANLTDGAVQAADVEGSNLLTIAIDTQPVNASVTSPDPATFSVVASGVGDLAYVWEVSSDTGSSWDPIVGETSASLTVESGDAEYVTLNQFRVVVSSESGAAVPVTSDAVTLTIA
jgi:hypothetical protein